MRISVSGDTLLRIVKSTPMPSTGMVRIVGLDDWAIRKGHRYGSILADQENRQVVEIVEGRLAEHIEPWFAAHPEVSLVTRDRSTDYRKGLNQAAPQAVQVADRFHLLMNLRQLAQRVTAAAYLRLKKLPDPPQRQVATPILMRPPSEQRRMEASRQRRLDLYNEVQRLKQAGVSASKIGLHLHTNYDTIRTYYHAETFPERMPGRTPHSLLKHYVDYTRSALRARVYPGSPTVPGDQSARLLGQDPHANPALAAGKTLTGGRRPGHGLHRVTGHQLRTPSLRPQAQLAVGAPTPASRPGRATIPDPYLQGCPHCPFLPDGTGISTSGDDALGFSAGYLAHRRLFKPDSTSAYLCQIPSRRV